MIRILPIAALLLLAACAERGASPAPAQADQPAWPAGSVADLGPAAGVPALQSLEPVRASGLVQTALRFGRGPADLQALLPPGSEVAEADLDGDQWPEYIVLSGGECGQGACSLSVWSFTAGRYRPIRTEVSVAARQIALGLPVPDGRRPLLTMGAAPMVLEESRLVPLGG